MARLILGSNADGFQTNMTVTGSDLHIVNEDGNRTVVGGDALTFKSGSSDEIRADFSNSKFRILSGSKVISETSIDTGTIAAQTITGSSIAKLSLTQDDGYTMQLYGQSSPRISFLGSAGAGGTFSLGVNTDGNFVINNSFAGLSNAEFRMSPSGHITASGNISSSGTIYAAQFNDDGTNLNVPDYVFEPEYVLRTLPEVEQHIEEHKHLPGIPSIDDKDGWSQLSVGDRDMKLLEKVEEFSLYIIDLQKQIDELKNK